MDLVKTTEVNVAVMWFRGVPSVLATGKLPLLGGTANQVGVTRARERRYLERVARFTPFLGVHIANSYRKTACAQYDVYSAET